MTILALIYLAGILLYSGVYTFMVNKVFRLKTTVSFKRVLIDCFFGALIGVVIAVTIFNLFKVTNYNGPYPPFNTKLLRFCCLLPALVILLLSTISFIR